MALNSGLNDFANSMAEAMQEAFFQAWTDYMQESPVPEPNPQMQLMFIAIAKGVIKHLTEHPEAFHISTVINDSHNHDVDIEILGE